MDLHPIIEKYELSTREFQCLELWASGFTLKGIGTRLGISPRTVESHINKVKGKTRQRYKDALLELFHSMV